jgi:putative ABC transport system permease protein
MRIRDLLYETWLSLIANKARSALTILGIVIGISSVIAMTSLIAGVQSQFVSELGLNQARMVQIFGGEYSFSEADIEQLKRVFPEYEIITTSSYGGGEAISTSGTSNVNMIGATEDFLKIMNIKVESGRLFSAEEEQRRALVVVVNKVVVKELFGDEEAMVIGKTFRMGQSGDTFTIIGILDSGNTPVTQQSSMVYLPITTLQARITGTQPIYELYGLAREDVDVVDLTSKTMTFLTEQRGEGVYVYSMREMLDQLNTVLMGFSIMLTAIASISLFVGGIGIMNMMLTNVTERTREIGLRKSLGAHTGDIVLQFLAEAIGLCLVGGIFGIIFGYLGAIGLAAIVNVTQAAASGAEIFPVIGIESIVIAVGVCAVIGIVFGFYPARRAAKLDPVESLRYQ